jgi:hypothetical protein
MAAKRETTMSTIEGTNGGGVNPMPETRVLYWILSDSNEGLAAQGGACRRGGNEVG